MKAILPLAIFSLICFTNFSAELFIRVSANAEHYAKTQNQVQYNSKNIFKFFDLDGGLVSLQIANKLNNFNLYNGSIYLKPNERVIAEVNQFGIFKIIQRIQIREINWYTTEVDYGYNNGGFPNHGPNDYYNNHVVNENLFQQFISSLENEAMDANKLKMAKNFVQANPVNAAQIARISKTFSFDSNRLDFAKHAYTMCVDQGNYFLLKDTFSFSSNYNSLLDYINKL